MRGMTYRQPDRLLVWRLRLWPPSDHVLSTGQTFGVRAGLWTTSRFVSRLLSEIRGAVLRFFVLHSFATLAQVVMVLMVAGLLSEQGSSVLPLPVAQGWPSLSQPSRVVVIVAAALIAVSTDFLADRGLIRARQQVPVVTFRMVVFSILRRPDRGVVLVGRSALGAVQLIALRGLALGQALRLFLLGVLAGLRGLALFGVAFFTAGISPIAVLVVVLLGAPFFLLGAQGISRLEALRPGHQRAARRATYELLASAAAVGSQPRLPLERGALTASSETERLIKEAEVAVSRSAETTVGRLLMASRAKFQYQMALVVMAAVFAVAVARFGTLLPSLDSVGLSALAPAVLSALLALRALASAFQGFVRLSSSVSTVRVLASIRAKASETADPWLLRQHLELAAELLQGADDEEHV